MKKKVFRDTTNGKIETGVDKLLALVGEKKEVSLGNAAKELNIDKDIMEHWVEALEEQGLIKIRLTLKERYLIHPDYYKLSNDNLSKFTDMLSINMPSIIRDKDPKEIMLNQKEKQIKAEIKLLNDKLNELKEYEKIKLVCIEKERAISEKLNKLDNNKKYIEDQTKILAKKEAQFYKKYSDLEKKEFMLAEKESQLNKKQDLISNQLKETSHKEKVITSKHNEIMDKHDDVIRKEKLAKDLFLRIEKVKLDQEIKQGNLNNNLSEVKKIRDFLKKRELELKKHEDNLTAKTKQLSDYENHLKKYEEKLEAKKAALDYKQSELLMHEVKKNNNDLNLVLNNLRVKSKN